MDYKVNAKDLELVLALVRAGTLAEAGKRLQMDGTTVFRGLQRIEKGLGQRLFQRSRQGYLASELCLALVDDAERIEAALESARGTLACEGHVLSGLVRISTTDTILHGLLMPVLRTLLQAHPALQLELNSSNESLNLTKRETDIALRATEKPPPHLVGKQLAVIESAVFTNHAFAESSRSSRTSPSLATLPWIAVDDALPVHPSVLWRQKHYPQVRPVLSVNSILSVYQAILQGLGIGVLPLFLTKGQEELIQLTDNLPGCATPLWLLSHPDVRYLRRISTVYDHISSRLMIAE